MGEEEEAMNCDDLPKHRACCRTSAYSTALNKVFSDDKTCLDTWNERTKKKVERCAERLKEALFEEEEKDEQDAQQGAAPPVETFFAFSGGVVILAVAALVVARSRSGYLAAAAPPLLA